MMPRVTDPEIDRLLVHYPDDPRVGCPFDTGFENAISKPSSERGEAKTHAD
jgi:acetylcholinesterase